MKNFKGKFKNWILKFLWMLLLVLSTAIIILMTLSILPLVFVYIGNLYGITYQAYAPDLVIWSMCCLFIVLLVSCLDIAIIKSAYRCVVSKLSKLTLSGIMKSDVDNKTPEVKKGVKNE